VLQVGHCLAYLINQSVRLDLPAKFRHGLLQVVPQSALQWGSLWPASGLLGACGIFGTVWSRTLRSCCNEPPPSTILSAVEGRTRQQPTSAPSRCALQKHLAADCRAPSQGLTKQFGAAVALNRFCFGDLISRLFCFVWSEDWGLQYSFREFWFCSIVHSWHQHMHLFMYTRTVLGVPRHPRHLQAALRQDLKLTM
jgi:hypothetical protein